MAPRFYELPTGAADRTPDVAQLPECCKGHSPTRSAGKNSPQTSSLACLLCCGAWRPDGCSNLKTMTTMPWNRRYHSEQICTCLFIPGFSAEATYGRVPLLLTERLMRRSTCAIPQHRLRCLQSCHGSSTCFLCTVHGNKCRAIALLEPK